MTSSYRIRATMLAASLLTILHCASSRTHDIPGRELGTGELTFRLLWKGRADLDLHVVSPLGEEIWFMEPTSESGGALDIDCNATPESICRRPVENVYWSRGDAPRGRYEYGVRLMNPHGNRVPVHFRVVVMVHGEIVADRRQELIGSHTAAGPWSFVH